MSKNKITFETKVLVEYLMTKMSYENANCMFYNYFMNLRTRIPTEWKDSNEHPH